MPVEEALIGRSDQIIERRNTDSIKWKQYPADVLPLWVADMDFLTPAPIRNAIRAMLDQGVLGYEFLQPRTKEVVARRMQKLHGWQVDGVGGCNDRCCERL